MTKASILGTALVAATVATTADRAWGQLWWERIAHQHRVFADCRARISISVRQILAPRDLPKRPGYKVRRYIGRFVVRYRAYRCVRGNPTRGPCWWGSDRARSTLIRRGTVRARYSWPPKRNSARGITFGFPPPPPSRAYCLITFKAATIVKRRIVTLDSYMPRPIRGEYSSEVTRSPVGRSPANLLGTPGRHRQYRCFMQSFHFHTFGRQHVAKICVAASRRATGGRVSPR
jgi:hypothetical protein